MEQNMPFPYALEKQLWSEKVTIELVGVHCSNCIVYGIGSMLHEKFESGFINKLLCKNYGLLLKMNLVIPFVMLFKAGSEKSLLSGTQ